MTENLDWIAIAQRGFEAWKAKPHNARWFRKIDGTPIPNDLTICIGQAFADELARRSPPPAVEGGWREIETAPKDGTRILLCWKAFSGVSEHVELGKWKSPNGDFVGGWCNTYGHAFNGTPDYYMPLPTPPAGEKP